MNRQEVYNRVKAHLLQQMKKSHILGSCCCRHPEGYRCAIGALVPDELYGPRMEGASMRKILSWSPDLKRHLGIKSDEDVGLLEKLQSIHDHGWPETWASQLEALAMDEGLRP